MKFLQQFQHLLPEPLEPQLPPPQKREPKDLRASLGNPAEWYKHVVIVRTDVQREYFPTEDAYLSEEECIERSEDVKQSIEELGITCSIAVADDNLADKLVALKPDLCINFVDSVRGVMSLCPGIPGIFDLLNIPYVGANTLCLSVNCNKYLTKTLLEAWQLPTPRYQLIRDVNQPLDYDLRFPLILKLNEEHGGVGCSERSVVTNPQELRAQAEFLMKTYKQAVLVEEFIDDGIELTAMVLESHRTNVYISERQYAQNSSRFKLLTFEKQYSEAAEDAIVYKQYIDKSGKLRHDIKIAFEILKMDDFGRFDIIVDKYGNHYIIDCNSNPSLGPDEPTTAAAKANGHSFQEILIRILQKNRKKPGKKNGNSQPGISH